MDAEMGNTPSRFEQVPNSRFFMQRLNDRKPQNPLLHHYHDCYELYYLYSGERYYFIQDKTYYVSAGSFVLINPYEIHRTGNLGSFGFDRMLIHFSRELLEDYRRVDPSIDLYRCLDANIHILSLDPREQIFAQMLLQTMEDAYREAHSGENPRCKLALIQLLLFLNHRKSGSANEALSHIGSTQKTIFEAVGYINTHYREQITLASISETFYLSKFHFSRSFKENTGFAFTQYLNNVRVKEAKHLLLSSSLTVNEIAAGVGFQSNTHFGRVFRQITGMSPSHYRQEKKG